MTNTIPNVPRELLENIVLCYNEGEFELGTLAAECHAILSAPSPAGVDGLEVVSAIAWMNTATKEATTHPVVVMDWDDEKEHVESLMPISQHEAIIDGLRGEVEVMTQHANNYSRMFEECAEERDQQAQCLKFARTTMAVVANNANLRGVEYRSLVTEVKRIDAALASGHEVPPCPN